MKGWAADARKGTQNGCRERRKGHFSEAGEPVSGGPVARMGCFHAALLALPGIHLARHHWSTLEQACGVPDCWTRARSERSRSRRTEAGILLQLPYVPEDAQRLNSAALAGRPLQCGVSPQKGEGNVSMPVGLCVVGSVARDVQHQHPMEGRMAYFAYRMAGGAWKLCTQTQGLTQS